MSQNGRAAVRKQAELQIRINNYGNNEKFDLKYNQIMWRCRKTGRETIQKRLRKGTVKRGRRREAERTWDKTTDREDLRRFERARERRSERRKVTDGRKEQT